MILGCFGIDVYLLNLTPGHSGIADTLQDKPNIVLISLDTVRADHLGLYGYSKPTSPFLDSLSSSSVVFERAFSTSSWTLPAHASLLTGKYVSSHGAHMSHQKLTETNTTLAELLKQAGYNTAGFIAGPYCKGKYGLSQGFTSYSDRLDFLEHRHTKDTLSIRRLIHFLSPEFHDQIFRTDGERTALEMNQEIFDWLDKNADSRFFLFLNYFDAHDPYDQSDRYKAIFTKEDHPYRTVHLFLDSLLRFRATYSKAKGVDRELLEYTKALYDAEIRQLDDHLRELVERFKQLGIYHDTLFIFMSDHGEEFLDHGSIFHEHTLYNELIHIPLFFHYPKLLPEKRISGLTSLVDVFPTVLSIVQQDSPKDIDGESLLPALLTDTPPERSRHIAERFRREAYQESGLVALVEQDAKLILSAPERDIIPNSLFSLENDFQEKSNLYQSKPEKRERLLSSLHGSVGESPAALLDSSS